MYSAKPNNIMVSLVYSILTPPLLKYHDYNSLKKSMTTKYIIYYYIHLYTGIYIASTFSIIWINRVSRPILLVVSSSPKMFFSLSPFAPKHLVSSIAPSRVSPHILHNRLNLVLTHGIPPTFRDGVHIYRQAPSGQPRVHQVTQLSTDGVHCRESAGIGPIVLSLFFVTTMDQYLCTSLTQRCHKPSKKQPPA